MRTIELEACTLLFMDNDVVHVHFRDGVVAGASEVDRMFDTIAAERDGRKVLLLVTVGQGASLSNEARAQASGERGSELIAADAIVVRDFGHQLSANAFVRHNRPKRPIQLFADRESALAWLLEQRGLIDRP